MTLETLFSEAADTDTHRLCGTCGERKLFSEFYKDGHTPDGKVRYRRDCKDCFKKARMFSGRSKLNE